MGGNGDRFTVEPAIAATAVNDPAANDIPIDSARGFGRTWGRTSAQANRRWIKCCSPMLRRHHFARRRRRRIDFVRRGLNRALQRVDIRGKPLSGSWTDEWTKERGRTRMSSDVYDPTLAAPMTPLVNTEPLFRLRPTAAMSWPRADDVVRPDGAAAYKAPACARTTARRSDRMRLNPGCTPTSCPTSPVSPGAVFRSDILRIVLHLL